MDSDKQSSASLRDSTLEETESMDGCETYASSRLKSAVSPSPDPLKSAAPTELNPKINMDKSNNNIRNLLFNFNLTPLFKYN